MDREPVLVTRPQLPPWEDFVALIEEAWENVWLTNFGPLLRRFTVRLAEYHGVEQDRLSLFANGTSALQLGLEALRLPPGSEVITTPFTFIATAEAIVRAGLRPVFCDIDPETFNIDPKAVEAAVTPNTSAIVAVHVFSRPCDDAQLSAIARRYDLKLVYDAAPATGTRVGGRSIASLGDITMFSLHATKLFHAVEGGVLVGRDPEVLRRATRMQNFGFDGRGDATEIGTNAKMSELHAAMGLALLEHIGDRIEDRRRLSNRYRAGFASRSGFRYQSFSEDEYNFAYFPMLMDDEETVHRIVAACVNENIHPRRYFYPAIHETSAFRGKKRFPVAESVSRRIVCLPLYNGLSVETIDFICEIVRRVLPGARDASIPHAA